MEIINKTLTEIAKEETNKVIPIKVSHNAAYCETYDGHCSGKLNYYPKECLQIKCEHYLEAIT